MEQVNATYQEEEQAWVTPRLTLQRDIYLMIDLQKPGKVVIRQTCNNGEFPRIPIKRHKDTSRFSFRMRVIPDTVTIQIFTSTEPKEIKYAYI